MIKAVEIFTIGHSNNSLETFLGLLRENNISALADVRSAPHSRMHPQFDRAPLGKSLKQQDIAYSFLGEELGGRPRQAELYENGRVQYGRVAKTEEFKRGIQRVVDGAARYRIALMCSEREPLECHRALLIARQLQELGISVFHILGKGRTESHEQTEDRLLSLRGLSQDLFLSRSELLQEAYAKQESRVSYLQKDTTTEVKAAP